MGLLLRAGLSWLMNRERATTKIPGSDGSVARNEPKNGFLMQVEQGFSSFFCQIEGRILDRLWICGPF